MIGLTFAKAILPNCAGPAGANSEYRLTACRNRHTQQAALPRIWKLWRSCYSAGAPEQKRRRMLHVYPGFC